MNNENKEAVKSVSAGVIISWVIGLVVIIMGIATLHIVTIIAGIIILPITNILSKKYLKLNFSGMARFIVAVLLIIIVAIASSVDKEEIVETPQQEVTQQSTFELGTYTIASEEFALMDSKQINVWQSYEDRTLVGKIEEGDIVEVIEYDTANDYCKIQSEETIGWIACGWLQVTQE